MSIGIIELNHVQITVPASAEESSKRFYGETLGLERISKPNENERGGAWYRQGVVELHLSSEEGQANESSRRHVCFVVADLGIAEAAIREAGVEIIPDPRPIAGWVRFYVRDPGGNRVEIAQRL
jgi:catechol 2,3-dioxygenase-like lactoylglutathione lyase family enzyme